MASLIIGSTYSSTILTILLLFLFMQSEAQLSSTFYDTTCPNALNTIRTAIRTAVSRERRMAASLIRLHFHDCFVNGCDASILLDDAPSIISEKNAINNFKSIRGYEVIDNAKSLVESICPGVVSCADIVAVAARDASFAVGGPSWTVKLGRRDSSTASLSIPEVESNLPSFRASLDSLISLFARKGLSARDMVALSGSHTIGQASCVTFRDRIYNNQSDIDAGFASTRRRQCPTSGGNGNLAPLDLVTPNSFDNNYFKNLIQKKGLLESDQILFSAAGSTNDLVEEYSKNPTKFKSDFAAAMIKMGDISPLTDSQGIIRTVCNAVN
ncbi:hypothetical protein Ddye_030465 [Dipteronia dyeriana]|uniref:Peroxidase n=2 Tax=Dipteronia dyeriana TaxID=168575 RepID=A0AAD9WMR7_9ROSI|nr:hypothetical protein Ddye_030465 [Dipteronia dyeriana]